MTILETREEWAYIEHWLENVYNSTNSAYMLAISWQTSDYTHPGQYLWIYPDDRTAFPDSEVWAMANPQDGDCVSMVIGSIMKDIGWMATAGRIECGQSVRKFKS